MPLNWDDTYLRTPGMYYCPEPPSWFNPSGGPSECRPLDGDYDSGYVAKWDGHWVTVTKEFGMSEEATIGTVLALMFGAVCWIGGCCRGVYTTHQHAIELGYGHRTPIENDWDYYQWGPGKPPEKQYNAFETEVQKRVDEIKVGLYQALKDEDRSDEIRRALFGGKP